jgi:hypothetical protein
VRDQRAGFEGDPKEWYFGKGFTWIRPPTGRADGLTLEREQSLVNEWCELFLKLANCRNFNLCDGNYDHCYARRDLLTKGDALMLLCYIIGGAEIPIKSFRVQGYLHHRPTFQGD